MKSNIYAAIEARLTCPKCDAVNRPGVIDVHLSDLGHAACDKCGHGDYVQAFLPKETSE